MVPLQGKRGLSTVGSVARSLVLEPAPCMQRVLQHSASVPSLPSESPASAAGVRSRGSHLAGFLAKPAVASAC